MCRHSAAVAQTFNKEVSNALCEKPIILVELLFELRIVVIQNSEDGKKTACKKCARKIVNSYRMFAELREALAGGRALDKGERLIASSAPGHKHLRHLVVQFLFEASDLATEVTPKASKTCEKKAEGIQQDMSDTNRPSSKLTKDSSSTRFAKSSQQRPYWQGKRKYDGTRNSNNNQSKNYQSSLHFRRKQ